MDDFQLKTEDEEDDKPIPKAADAAAAAKLMVGAMFDAVRSAKDGAAGPISFTMSPNEDGTVELAGTNAVIAAIKKKEENECKHCHEVPCFYLQREEEIGNYSEYLFDTEGMGNKERRFRMYRYMSQLYEGFLGKGNRKELPYCLVSEARDCFPKEKDDVYTGFKESEEQEGDTSKGL